MSPPWPRILVFLAPLLLAGCPEALPEPITSIDCDACAGECLIEQFEVTSATHISGGVDYPDRPPVGGDHDPCWAPYGVHDTEVQDENWVHNLEHGAVVLLHNCPEGCADDVAVLEGVSAAAEPDTTLVTPYSEMKARFAAVSWAWRITLGCADGQALTDFYDEHVGQAPEATSSPPPEACMD